MKKLNKLVDRFVASSHESAQIVIDIFEEVGKAIDEKQIKKGDNAAFDYEVRNILEVFDSEKFPEDYAFLQELNELLESLED